MLKAFLGGLFDDRLHVLVGAGLAIDFKVCSLIPHVSSSGNRRALVTRNTIHLHYITLKRAHNDSEGYHITTVIIGQNAHEVYPKRPVYGMQTGLLTRFL
ncbi:MAG: hypothetical protein Kow0077_05510 [Anaerolineae bacterium]